MDGLYHELSRKTDPAKVVGYLNYSDGRPDPKWQRLLAEAFAFLGEHVEEEAIRSVFVDWLRHACRELAASNLSAFRDVRQAEAVIEAAFVRLPQAYRAHHADLLAHQDDANLFTAFFLARAAEAVLSQGPPWSELPRLVQGALGVLNDYVGYRPLANLETRASTDYYPHEKVRPVPLYIKGAGVAPGRYADLIRAALELLASTDRSLLDEAFFDLDRLDELAFDPRAHDHFHPINKRPNVLFGDWDPHLIDNKGYYRRFVLREMTLQTLLSWAHTGGEQPGSPYSASVGTPAERLFEASAVLAGTMLMGSGICGAGPNAFDSSVTLAKLVPKIARYRDAFYQRLLEVLPGPHGDRLRQEAASRRQPFAGVRQYLNQAIASQRAAHLQDRRLALLFAHMGFPQAARERAKQIAVPAVRFGTEIRIKQTEAEFRIRNGPLDQALSALEEAEELLHRGIDCGAFIDPWNILAFQGLYPIFSSREDTVRDPRAEELISLIARQMDLYAHLQSSLAVSGLSSAERIAKRFRSLAEWWDRFATSAVSDLPRIVGRERADAAEHVASALAAWTRRDPSKNDLTFWRQHREGFNSPAAYAQVIEALLDHHEWRAAMALLMTWLSESDLVPLEDPAASFERLAERWLRAVISASDLSPSQRLDLARRFFELLEANAHDWWDLPDDLFLEPADSPQQSSAPDDTNPDNAFGAAYEGMIYKDSADDGEEGSVAEGPELAVGEFALDTEAEPLEQRLRFLLAVARLWRIAAMPHLWIAVENPPTQAINDWLLTAQRNQARLRRLLERLDAIPIPEPTIGPEAMIEYDRRRALKGHLLDLGVAVCVDLGRAARSLSALLTEGTELPPAPAESGQAAVEGLPPSMPASSSPPEKPTTPLAGTANRSDWELLAIRIEKALGRGEPGLVRRILPSFITRFRGEPLLYCPPSDGGKPAEVLRAQTALHVLEDLVTRLPSLGLIRETFLLTRLARQMEWNEPPHGRRVSSYDQLFRTALTHVVDAILDASLPSAPETDDDTPLAGILMQVGEAFQDLWIEHSQSLRLSVLESVGDEADWRPVREFIKTYGGDLFTVSFLALSNMRGILARGVAAWLDQEAAENDSARRPQLLDLWEKAQVDRTRIARYFEITLQALVEHYDEYRDYNTTTTQSDYGENLHILLDFLRLKVAYERAAWRIKPLALVHEVLCRRGQESLAGRWREFLAEKTNSTAAELLEALARKEQLYGIRLRTIRDRLEERFLLPLEVDRAVARVPPAVRAAWSGAGESHPAFQGLLDALTPLAETVSGVGLDVPGWIRRMEEALRQAREQAALGYPEDDGRPRYPVDLREIRKQLSEWDKPLE